MMKKIYSNPITVSAEMEEEEMIAASLNINGDSGSAPLNDEPATGPALGRKSFWDNDAE